MYAFILIDLIIIAYAIKSFMRSPVSSYVFSMLCYAIVLCGGVIFVYVIDAVIGYKMALDVLPVVQGYAILGFLIFCSAHSVTKLLLRGGRIHGKRRGDYGKIHIERDSALCGALWFLASLSIISALIFAFVNGLSFGQDGYESRYDDSRGLGLLTLMLPSFLPLFSYYLLTARSGHRFAKVAAIGFGYALLIYVLLHGYRQIAMACGLLIALVALMQQRIGKITALWGIIFAFPVVLLGLAFLRYAGEQDATFDSGYIAAIYYLQGDIFPVDAPIKVINFLKTYDGPGLEIFWNHFNRFIPRIIWPDKPDIIYNAAGYYTQVVVGYDRGVTLSPTIMGEGLLIDGGYGFCWMVILSGAFCAIYDQLMIAAKGGLLKCVLISYVYFGFFLVREGFESTLYRFLVSILFWSLAYAAYMVIRPFRKRVVRA